MSDGHDEALDRLIQTVDLDGLVRLIDARCATGDWAGLLRVTMPIWSLYGDLSALNRTSRYGRKTFTSPNSSASASASCSNGLATRSSKRARWAAHHSFVLFWRSSA